MPPDTATNHLWLKRSLGALSAAWPRHSARAAVLLYHSVGGGPWSTPAAAFHAQLAWLSENFELSSLDRALALAHEPGQTPSVAITFDDGYATLIETALPALERAGAAAAVYLNTGEIAETGRKCADVNRGHSPGESFLTWTEVKRLHKAGWTIGSHGFSHLDLTRAPAGKLAAELETSKRSVEQHIDTACSHFSYPWGRHSSQVRKAVQAAGYLTGAAGYHAPLAHQFDPYAFPRIAVDPAWTLDDFKAVLRGDWDYLGWLQDIRQRSR